MGSYLIDVFIDKHRTLCLKELAMAYIATNISVGYLAHVLAFEKENELETFLTSLGNFCTTHFFCVGCKLTLGTDGKKILSCREALPLLKKAKLKVKAANK